MIYFSAMQAMISNNIFFYNIDEYYGMSDCLILIKNINMHSVGLDYLKSNTDKKNTRNHQG